MMCNSCYSNCCCGCALMENVASALNNLFSTRPYCNCSGCSCNRNSDFLNGFMSGVNAANTCDHGHGCGWFREGRSGCGCCDQENRSGYGNCRGREGGYNCGCRCGRRDRCGSDCGSCGTRNLSAYTNCGDALNDEYYARQYGLISCPVRICSCN